MSFKKTLIFLVILLLLGGYYYIVEVRMAEKKQTAEEAGKRLFQFSEDAIEQITLTRTDEAITLHKQEDVWTLLVPVADSVDEPTVNSMLSGLADAERAQTITEKSSNDEEFGLDAPELIVTVTVREEEQEQEYTLSLGSKTPTSSDYYARVGETPAVITVSSSLKTNLDKTLYDVRDKTILDLIPEQVKHAEFSITQAETGLSETIRLSQTNETWEITSPKVFKADTTKMNTLLSSMTAAKIAEFVEETPQDLAQYGLDQPGRRLSLVVGDDDTQKILLLGRQDDENNGVYAKHAVAENVFLVPAHLLENFPNSVNDLRDRALLSYNNEDVQQIELVSADERLVLELQQPAEEGEEAEAVETTEPSWRIVQPAAYEANSTKVSSWLWDAREIAVEQFVSDGPVDLSLYGLDPPQLSLSIWTTGQEQPQQLLLGNADAEQTGVYAKLAGQDSIMLVTSEALEQVKKTAFDLRKRNILAFTQDSVEKMQFTYSDDTTLVLEKRGDAWKAKEPEKADLTTYKISNILYDLETLEFIEEITESEADLSAYGLEPANVEVTLWEKGQEQGITLLIGTHQEQGTLYAKPAAGEIVYGIEPAFLDELPRAIADLSE